MEGVVQGKYTNTVYLLLSFCNKIKFKSLISKPHNGFFFSFDFVQNDIRPSFSLQGSELDIIALLFQLLREEIS